MVVGRMAKAVVTMTGTTDSGGSQRGNDDLVLNNDEKSTTAKASGTCE